MKSLNIEGQIFVALVMSLLASLPVVQAEPRLETDIQAVQAEIRQAQGALTTVRQSKGRDTAQFDAAIRRLRDRVNFLDESLQAAGTGGRDLEEPFRPLNAYLRSLEQARHQSDWRSVERDLGRLDAAAGELYAAALRVPGAPERVVRPAPKPPATGPDTAGVPAVPKPAPSTELRRDVPSGIPQVVRPGPGPKGPDDPRFAVAPPPVEEPEPPPPPPDDDGGGKAKPLPMDGPLGAGAPPMLRKPARPPVRVEDDIPRPKPGPGAESPAAYPGQDKERAGSPKIRAFLDDFAVAGSLAEVRSAYERGNFTAAETRDLERQVQVGQYNDKLNRLVEDEQRNSSVVVDRKRPASLSKKRDLLQTRQRQELKQLNIQAQNLLGRLKSEHATLRRGPAAAETIREFSPGTPATGTRAIDMDERHARLPSAEEVGEILSISGTVPQDGSGYFDDWGIPGGFVIITGNYFGAVAGEVKFIPESLRDQQRAIPVAIESWSEHRIVGRIPQQEVMTLLGDGHHVGRMIVKRRGAETGPGREFNIVARSPSPRITGVSTATGGPDGGSITPGQTIIIMGQDFAPDTVPGYARRPEVLLEHTGPTGARITTPLEVLEFDNSWISAALGLIEGVPGSSGTLKVRRAGDGEESLAVRISFLPTLDTWVIADDEEHHCLGFFGWKDTLTLHDHALGNDWKVVNHDTEKRGRGGHGCNWLQRPVEGSAQTAARLEMWCDLFSWVRCTSEVTIEGPAGMDWR
jgi:hypothetical protein